MEVGCGGGKTPPDQVSGAPPGSKNPKSGMEPPGPRFQKPEMCTLFFWGFSGKVLDFLRDSENRTAKSAPYRGAKSPSVTPPRRRREPDKKFSQDPLVDFY